MPAGQGLIARSYSFCKSGRAKLNWPGGLAVRDVHALPLPDDLAPGRYDLVLSLKQRLEDGQERRVPLANSGATELRLGPVKLPLP